MPFVASRAGAKGKPMIRQHKEMRPESPTPAYGFRRNESSLRALTAHVVSEDGELRAALSASASSGAGGPIEFSFSTLADGIDPLLAPGLDALAIDIGSGGSLAFAFLARAIALGPDAPVIAIGEEDARLHMAAIEAGAEDCIGVDAASPRALMLAIRRAVTRCAQREGHEKQRAPLHPEPRMTLVQESSDAIVILDNRGFVRFANTAAEELLGRKTSELLGKPFGLPSDPGEHEIAIIRPDGDNRLAEMRIVETRWGGVPARVAALNDVTVRSKLERAMMDAEARSRETRKRSQSFFSNVNHDLRTPLTHIIGFSELMKNEQFGPMGQSRYRDYAQDIYSSGRMLLDMIEDLLGIAEAETEEINLTNEICNLRQLLEIAAASQRIHAGEEGIKIEIDCPAKLPGLRGDARRLRQGLFRLIAEAIHCARHGATLKLTAREEDDGRIALTLAEVPQEDDTDAQSPLPYGFGLHEDPFVSAENSGSAREGSLALSLTRKVMELHGGKVDVRNSATEPMMISLSFPSERVIR